MKYKTVVHAALLICLVIFAVGGCGTKEEKAGGPQIGDARPGAQQSETAPITVQSQEAQSGSSAVVVDVDGTKLTQGELDTEIKKKFAAIKDKIPAERTKQVRESMKRQVINDFIMRTLLKNEVKRLGITSSEQEVGLAVAQLRNSLPAGMTLEDMMKKNRITKEEMEEEIRLGIKINKLVLSQTKGKAKPTEKEISRFYQKNKEKFKMPESVHVRHILIAKTATDNEAVKAERKAKAENLRKQLLEGADFAELAKKYSDCPSKESGGDLGILPRGQSVKPFEDAAFSQQEKAIGPVVETDFGYHIIQVLEHRSARTLTLDERTKEKVSTFLEQQKQQDAFDSLMKKLKTKANIVVHLK